jgi:hypothetical protein
MPPQQRQLFLMQQQQQLARSSGMNSNLGVGSGLMNQQFGGGPWQGICL